MPKHTLKWMVLIAILALVLAGCAQPVPIAPAAEAPAAEAPAAVEGAAEAAGEAQRGGVWTRTTSSDAGSLIPVLQDNTASSDVGYMLHDLFLIGGDLETGEINCDFALCESWEISEDGLTYTFKLHEGYLWSDGEEITADDFVYTYNAIKSDLVESPRKYAWDGIASIEAPDPYTVVVKYDTLTCDALTNLGQSAVMPSHIFAPDFSDVMTSPEGEAPSVVSGPYTFQSWTRDDNLIIVRNETFRDGAPYMDGMIYRVIPDAGARLAMLLSGESQIARIQPNQLSAIEGNPDITRYTWADDGYTYIGLNHSDPANPTNGMDENGNIIPQPPHPILGDKLVRQAIAYALDYDSIINDIYFGQGFRQTANVMPAVSWAYNNDLAPYNYDPEKAASLLDEAGWVDSNGDGVREKDGKDLTLSLITNAGNTTRGDLGAYVQDALGQIGFSIDFQTLEFGTVLEQMDAQTYDMYILGWTGLGSDPANDLSFFNAENDIVGSGFNNVSYYNEEFERLSAEGRSVVGCAPEDRAPSYMQIQEIIHDEIPYIFITGSQSNIGYRSDWAGLDPKPWAASEPVYWNPQQWYLKSATAE